ncbi:hypothetical protein [Mucilaginibacter pedocola]|uniref:Uncharacterized protein n=1 Tax=Mucilaginibacter pedocola TaxID=1792845 RepID=A0A1S9PM84_9SPHI|nr:hypothetical protein [Mucilaginibacter pedocola]OOQ62070.1 hypothetical protein BC343_03195 [Mucilaginibacter pedocola]
MFYKPTKSADKTKLKPADFLSFSLEADSFVVSKNKALSSEPFLRVALHKDTSNIYQHYYKDKWYYGSNPDMLTKFTKKNYIEVLNKLMADKPKVLAKINNKHWAFGEMADLVSYYVHYEEWWAATDTQQ